MYSTQLLDHFQRPRNAGVVEGADAVIEMANPACGDVVHLSVRVAEGRIAEIAFRAKGCVPTMGCSSAVTELAKGKRVSEALRISREEVLAAVGGLPDGSNHAAVLAVDALIAVLKALSAGESQKR